jgi:hypothetical protein
VGNFIRHFLPALPQRNEKKEIHLFTSGPTIIKFQVERRFKAAKRACSASKGSTGGAEVEVVELLEVGTDVVPAGGGGG